MAAQEVEDGGKIELLKKQLNVARAEAREALIQQEVLKVTGATLEKFLKPMRAPRKRRRVGLGKGGGVEYDGILFLSDFHFPEIVKAHEIDNANAFCPTVCLDRLWTLAVKVGKITENNRKALRINKLWVIFGGDICTGIIHDEIVKASPIPVLQATSQIASVCAQMIAYLSDFYPRIEIVVVPGNHGRMEKKMEFKRFAQNNLDMLFGDILSVYLTEYKNKGIVGVTLADSQEVVVEIAGNTFLVGHGHNVKSKNQIVQTTAKQHVLRRYTGPLPAIESFGSCQEAVDWAKGVIRSGFNYRLMGHWHDFQCLDNGRIIVNGSLVGGDEFSFSNMSMSNEPLQLFMLASDEFMPSPIYPIQLQRGVKKHQWDYNADGWGSTFVGR